MGSTHRHRRRRWRVDPNRAQGTEWLPPIFGGREQPPAIDCTALVYRKRAVLTGGDLPYLAEGGAMSWEIRQGHQSGWQRQQEFASAAWC